MTRLIRIAFILIGIILIAACSKIAPIDQKVVSDDPSFMLKSGDADNMNNDDGEEGDGSGGSITDPDDDDDEIDTSNSGSGITDPDDDDDEIIPGSDGHKPGGNAGGSGSSGIDPG